MLDIMGISRLDRGFTVGIAVLNQEILDDYSWAMRHLKNCFLCGILFSIIGADCEEALINTLELNFPQASTNTVICHWYVSMNVLKHCKALYETEEIWEDFLQRFRECIFAKTEEEFDDIINEWKERFGWNNGYPYTLPKNADPAQVQICARKKESRRAIKYCLGQWLGKYKTKAVYAFIKCFFHAGTTTNSRI